MRSRFSHASRASSNGALRAVPARDARHTEHDSAGVEPFDDVRETAGPPDADGHGLNGRSGHGGHGEAGAPPAHASNASNEMQHEPLSPDDPLAPLPFNPYKGNRGLTRAWHAMRNSLAGFSVAIREESAFRQELTLAAILLPCGLLVPVEPVARVLLLGSVLLVLIVELLNSSVEAAIDRISLERHELSRRAKDLGSAAVMVALGMCLMTWGLIAGPLVVRWVKAWF
ncbi:diacylglycerol kinase [Paraburkholderia phenoliruptrix]|uniref:diacylglycerol kinase n=1 Tax=Paraburkholderia phenoliruptrix TaxID=252970 RepID=UPI002869963F|nr:diacylglycerol kinase [Paraburkholderia phenoliruptrix]WMY07132.1 diacylglycerol kinase [Paraburkholderia phenoliruptrix]